MFLRDFYLEADRDEIGRRRALEFKLVARPIVLLYGECFESRKVYDSWRFAVFATRDKHSHRDLIVPSGVATIMWYVDFTKFFARTGANKQKAVLRILHEAVLEIAKAKGLARAPFEVAHKRVQSLQLRVERECLRLRGKNGYTAIVRGFYEVDRFVAEILVQNRHGFVVGREIAFRAKADEVYFRRKLGRLRWEGTSRVSLLSEQDAVVARLQL